jgi:SAM-dependent methyltransferase
MLLPAAAALSTCYSHLTSSLPACTFLRIAAPPKLSAQESNARYALGDTTSELQRLSIQHNIFAGETRALYALAGFKYGDVLCDVGCGPGTTTFELAQLAGPKGKVIATDSSSDGLSRLRGKALDQGYSDGEDDGVLHHADIAPIELCERDAAAPSPLSATPVDGLWCRWLLTWISQLEADGPGGTVSPLTSILRNCRAALRPGGTAVFWDYFCDAGWGVTSSVPTPEWDRLLMLLGDEWRQVGDPAVASKLPARLVKEGFELVSIKSIAPIVLQSSADWIWPSSYFALQARRLANEGKLTNEDVERFDAEWALIGDTPGSFYCPPTMAAIVARRPA